MEEMNARVMENEVMDETVEVDEAVDSGNAGALVAGIVGGFLAYAVIGGAKKLWGFAGAQAGRAEGCQKGRDRRGRRRVHRCRRDCGGFRRGEL